MPTVRANVRGYTVVVNRDRSLATIQPDTRDIVVRDRAQVQQVRESVRTVEVAAPGPQGVAGVDGAPGGTSEPRIASEALGGHRLVRSTGADSVGYADSTNPAHGDDTQGMTLGAADALGEVDVQRVGSVTFAGWAWTQGAPVYLGANGLPTQAVPDPGNGDAFSQVIGHAEAPTVLYLSIEPPVYF